MLKSRIISYTEYEDLVMIALLLICRKSALYVISTSSDSIYVRKKFDDMFPNSLRIIIANELLISSK